MTNLGIETSETEAGRSTGERDDVGPAPPGRQQGSPASPGPVPQSAAWVLLLILAYPASARANAGTTLMAAEAGHLLFGNALIGALEGYLLSRWYGVERGRATGAMVLANYFSMLLPWLSAPLWVSPVADRLLGDSPLYRAGWTLAALIVVSLAATIVLEWPCVLAAMRDQKNALRRSLPASARLQAASYALLVPFYLLVSPTTLLTRVRLASPAAIGAPVPATVYYLSPDDGDVYAVRLDGRAPRRAAKAGLNGSMDRLVSRRTAAGTWEFCAVLPGSNPNRPDVRRVLPRIAGWTADSSAAIRGHLEYDTWMSFGRATDLRREGSGEWEARTDFWATNGLTARNTRTGQSLWLALETPWLRWISRNAAILPGDRVVYQLGDQVVLLDPNTRRLALVARGRGPVVFLDAAP